MNLEQLAGFVEVAATGHFTQAAANLHLAQPSLSRQISTLENELGSELFHRARGHIRLTAAGESLLPRARRMLADAESIRVDMAELAGLRRGRVRFGATPTLCVSLVAEAITAFRASHPGIELVLVEKGSHELIRALGAGELDLALVTRTLDSGDPGPRLRMRGLLTEDLVVVASDTQGDDGGSAPLLTADTLTLAEVADLPQVQFHHGYDLRAATSAAFDAAGIVPEVVIEGGEMDAVLRFVERGLGIAVVPALVLVERPHLRWARLIQPHLSRTVSLATRADVRATRAASAMEVTIRATARDLAGRTTGLTSVVAG